MNMQKEYSKTFYILAATPYAMCLYIILHYALTLGIFALVPYMYFYEATEASGLMILVYGSLTNAALMFLAWFGFNASDMFGFDSNRLQINGMKQLAVILLCVLAYFVLTLR